MLSDRQQQIIEESIKLIDSKGIQGFTIKNLSKEIGISEPAIYRHFENKFEILNTILDSFKTTLLQNKKIVTDVKINPEERLRSFFENIFVTFTKNPAFTSVIFSEEIFQNESALLEKINNIQEENERMIQSVLVEMQTKQLISMNLDIEAVTMMIFGSIRLLVKKWKYVRYNFSLIEKGNNLFNTLIIIIK